MQTYHNWNPKRFKTSKITYLKTRKSLENLKNFNWRFRDSCRCVMGGHQDNTNYDREKRTIEQYSQNFMSSLKEQNVNSITQFHQTCSINFSRNSSFKPCTAGAA